MVVADEENPGPSRKRPRLSLKPVRKNESNQPETKYETQGLQGTTPQDLKDTSQKDDCDDSDTEAVITLQEDPDSSKNVLPSEGPIIPPVASLENLGNTCFLNSVLEILRYTPGFLEGLGDLYCEIIAVEKKKQLFLADHEKKEESLDVDMESSVLAFEFAKDLYLLYKSMEKREERYAEIASTDVSSMAVKPDKILSVIRELNPMFEGNLQHDAQELLRCLLCYLEDAETELHKTQVALLDFQPPSVSNMPEKPINPIMQQFLAAGKQSVRRRIFGKPGIKSEKLETVVNGEDQMPDGKSDVNCEVNSKSEAGSDHKKSESLPKTSCEDAVDTTVKSETPLNQCESHSTLPNGLISKSSRRCSRGSNSSKPYPSSGDEQLLNGGVDSGDKKDSRRNKPSKQKRASKGKLENNDNSTEPKKVRSDNNTSDSNKSQPSILSMFGKMESSACKRLGMRGAVVKKDANTNCHLVNGYVAEERADSDMSKPETAAVAAETFTKPGNCDAPADNKPSTKLVQNFSKLNCCSPSKPSSSDSNKLLNSNFRQPMLKLEKCDYVCGGLNQSVDVNMAMKHLSPNKKYPNSLSSTSSSQLDTSTEEMYGNSCSFKSVPIKQVSIKVEKCDSVCGSPAKSVNAQYAMRCLSGPRVPKKDFVERLFQGTMMLRTRCLECEFSRERREEFQDVSVPLRRERENEDEDTEDEDEFRDDSCLGKLISAFMEVERLRDENKYFCEVCFRYVEAERSLHYDILPDILTLHLKRFSASYGLLGTVSKINDHVEIPLSLPCLRYKCPKPCCRSDHRYTLFGVITHAGLTISSGHYLSYVKVCPNSDPVNPLNDLNSSNSDQSNLEVQLRISKFIKYDSVNSQNSSGNEDRSNNSGDTDTCYQWLACDDETIRIYSEEEFHKLLQGEEGSLMGSPYVLFYHRTNRKGSR